MAKRTSIQAQRQDYREGGRYSKVNPCQACGKSAGVEYYSHPLTDTGGWDDIAICLCKRCAKETYDMEDVSEFLEYQEKYK